MTVEFYATRHMLSKGTMTGYESKPGTLHFNRYLELGLPRLNCWFSQTPMYIYIFIFIDIDKLINPIVLSTKLAITNQLYIPCKITTFLSSITIFPLGFPWFPILFLGFSWVFLGFFMVSSGFHSFKSAIPIVSPRRFMSSRAVKQGSVKLAGVSFLTCRTG